MFRQILGHLRPAKKASFKRCVAEAEINDMPIREIFKIINPNIEAKQNNCWGFEKTGKMWKKVQYSNPEILKTFKTEKKKDKT